jgi:hypothetical protein
MASSAGNAKKVGGGGINGEIQKLIESSVAERFDQFSESGFVEAVASV